MRERQLVGRETYLAALVIVGEDEVDVQGTIVVRAVRGLMRAPVRAFYILCIVEQIDRGKRGTQRDATVAECMLRPKSPGLGVEERRTSRDLSGLAAELINRAPDRLLPIAQIGSE